MFTVCALLYGDHPTLAERCLGGIAALPTAGPGPVVAEVRVACNAVGDRTDEVVRGHEAAAAAPWRVLRQPNVYKYPAMRGLFYDRFGPVATPYVMWFDDDSFVRTPTAGWLAALADVMRDADVAGSLFRCGLTGCQHNWVRDQPWYGGKHVMYGRRVRFAAGGWWCARYDFLRAHDWPVRDIRHRGGDVMLGELVRQQGGRLRAFTAGVAVNADAAGVEHRSARRGYDERPVGAEYYKGAGKRADDV